MNLNVLPKVQNYSDYRVYLSDWFKASKSSNPKMSFRYVAKNLGLSSPNHFQLVVTKQRHFSKSTFVRMQKLLKLKSKEKSYLSLLFELEFQTEIQARNDILEKMNRLAQSLLDTEVSPEQYAVLSNSIAWYLRMGALQFNGKTASEIAHIVTHCCPFQVAENQVLEALNLLIQLGTAHIESQKYVFDMESLKSDWDFDDQQIKQFHYNNLLLAARTIPFSIDSRFLSNLTIPCNQEIYNIAKQEIRNLCLKLLDLSESKIHTSADCEKVISLQFAMFPYFEFSKKNIKDS